MSNQNSLDKWDWRFIDMAKMIAQWSKDPSSKIGAIAVDDNHRILGTGYNGFNRFDKDNISDYYIRETKYSKIIHAEKNLILNCLNNGVDLKGATMYVFGLPVCKICANEIAQVSLKRIVAIWDKDSNTYAKWAEEWEKFSKPAFEAAGVSVESVSVKIEKPKGVVAVEFNVSNIRIVFGDGSVIIEPPFPSDLQSDRDVYIRSLVEHHG